MQMPSDKEIQERFDDLPREVQKAIQSADMASALRAVGAEHGLHLDQLGLLEDEALLIMLGFSNPTAFTDRVREALHLDPSTATAVAAEVSERLFVPIRASMRQYMEERLRNPSKRTAGGAQLATSAPATAPQSSPSTTSTVTSASSGGKTIMPSPVEPVLHPADQALSAPSISMPTVTNFTATPPQENKGYSVDPYREPVE